MPAVDHEGVLLDLKKFVLSKRSHGQDELLRVMNKAELENLIPEGQEGFDARTARPESEPPSTPAQGQPRKIAAAS